MKSLNLIAASLAVALVVTLGGCGSDNREDSQVPQVAASQACIACHSSTASRVTQNSVVSDYLKSAHSTKAGGAGCDDCHHVDGHPGNGTIPQLPSDTVCVNCHTATVPMTTAAAHFSNISASYLGGPESKLARTLANAATNNSSSSSCNGCHNPHDPTTLLPVNKQWAQSGHADTTDDPFKELVFIKRSGTGAGDACNRCHSATGFRYYMTKAQSPITATILGAYSSAKEVISCNACHTDYSFNRISSDPRLATPTFTPPAFVSFSAPFARFPNVGKFFPGTLNNPAVAGNFDVGDSKLCISCHGGRRNSTGASVSAATTSPTDPHHFPAAGVMYMKIGFINFTTQTAPIFYPPTTSNPTGASTYGKSLISSDDIGGSGVTSTHRKLGTAAIHNDSHNPSFFVPGNLDSNGPCVTCHMAAGHTWNILPDTYNKVCINCHQSERGLPLNADNFLTAFVDENRDQMNNALSLAVKLLETNYDITVQLADIEDPVEAAFKRKSTGQNIDWTTFTTDVSGNVLTADQLMRLKGAMFNVQIGYQENTAFLHARTYMRRLLYDSIDWLDDRLINRTVGTTALSPLGQSIVDASGNPVFGKNATRAFADGTLTTLAAGTTPSMTYILGFNRSDGTWTTTTERP